MTIVKQQFEAKHVQLGYTDTFFPGDDVIIISVNGGVIFDYDGETYHLMDANEEDYFTHTFGTVEEAQKEHIKSKISAVRDQTTDDDYFL